MRYLRYDQTMILTPFWISTIDCGRSARNEGESASCGSSSLCRPLSWILQGTGGSLILSAAFRLQVLLRGRSSLVNPDSSIVSPQKGNRRSPRLATNYTDCAPMRGTQV